MDADEKKLIFDEDEMALEQQEAGEGDQDGQEEQENEKKDSQPDEVVGGDEIEGKDQTSTLVSDQDLNYNYSIWQMDTHSTYLPSPIAEYIVEQYCSDLDLETYQKIDFESVCSICLNFQKRKLKRSLIEKKLVLKYENRESDGKIFNSILNFLQKIQISYLRLFCC